MNYEELLISIDLKGYENVLPSIGKACLGDSHWFVVCDDGDCYLYDKNGKEDDIKKVTTIYEHMIPKNVKKIVIPNNATSIRQFAFDYCRGLTNVTIRNSVMNIGDYAFDGCRKLENVTIPNSIMSIGFGAFCDCSNLKSLIFKGKSLKQVKAMANYPFGIEDESIIKCI